MALSLELNNYNWYTVAAQCKCNCILFPLSCKQYGYRPDVIDVLTDFTTAVVTISDIAVLCES